MIPRVLTRRWNPSIVYIHGDGSLRFSAGATIDADGDPRSYHPVNSKGLDDHRNAGYPTHEWYRDILVCDKNGHPVTQDREDPAPGYFISRTAYEHASAPPNSVRRYLWSSCVPYIVIPGPLRGMVKGVILGAKAEVTYNGKTIEAVVGDIGPANKIGEMSIKCADLLGIASSPRDGGCSKGVEYVIFPGVAAKGYTLKPA